MKKFLVFGGILLGVVVLFWIGVSLYDTQLNIDIDPLAEQYMVKINGSFDIDVVNIIAEKTNVLQVSPKILRNLEKTVNKDESDEENKTDSTEETTNTNSN